jgi:hypothetical protein
MELRMSSINTLPARQLAQALWLHVALSHRLDAADVEDWQQRLREFLSHRGLLVATSLDRIAVIPACRPLAHFDRGLVMGWLLAQPEVVFVRVDRRSAPRHAAAVASEVAHG